MKIVANLKDSVAGILSGIDISNVSNLYGALERAARVLVQKADIPEASNTQNITLYSGVTDYLCDTTIFGTAIRDLYPQGTSRQINDFVYKKPGEMFDRTKGFLPNGTMVTFRYVKGVPVIRIVSTKVIPKIILDSMNDTTGWTAGGDASGLTKDSAFYYQEPASLRFNLAAFGSQGYLEKTLTSTIDLTGYQGQGVCFLAVYTPTGADFSSFGVRLGSDSANYYEVTNTSGFLGSFQSGEFQLVALDLSLATTVGTPDITKIDYLRAIANYNGNPQTNVRFGNLWISQPCPSQILFQTAAIFLAAGASPSASIVDDNDSIVLNDPAYTLLEYESAIEVLIQSGGTLGSPMHQMINAKLHGSGNDIGLYAHYSGDNPSEELRTVGSWYDNN